MSFCPVEVLTLQARFDDSQDVLRGLNHENLSG